MNLNAEILNKNIAALISGTNEPLARKLLDFLKSKSFTRFSLSEDFNIYDKSNQTFMYENLENELEHFYTHILASSPRYPFICLYGIANAFLVKKLARHYKHIFVFESELELFALALSSVDLSLELTSGKVYLIDSLEEKVATQLLILFDQKDMFEYLLLYELFINNAYYSRFYEQELKNINEFILEHIQIVIRNLNLNSKLPLLNYQNFLSNTPAMLQSIPFQKLLSQRKGKFDTAIVVSAGPSLNKQLELLAMVQEKAVIFCADGSLNTLLACKIKPDYVTNLDYSDHALKFFQCTLPSKTINAISASTHPNMLAKLENKCVILKTTPIYERFGLSEFGYLDVGTQVSHFSYVLALELGFKTIIMLGQDLAFDEAGNSHAKGFAYGQSFEAEEEFTKLKVLAYGGKGEVLTHYTWYDYKIKLEFLFSCNALKAKFYNATEGGARIAFTEELSFKECCERFLSKEKPEFEVPKSLPENKSKKLLLKFKEKLQKDQKTCELFLNDSTSLYQALDNILNSNKDLPLEFLQSVKASIEKLNFSLDTSDFCQDGMLRAVFFQRGRLISKVLNSKIQDEKLYLFHFVCAYKEWLELFIQALDERKKAIEEALFER
ncbi:motility associated factor glycosyltransferase family protein [Campylobacter sp. MIT 12-8780]|uniref:motility associated factor glycosyltransferase family protein n=1 Tax=Campylobacter sp. MIT 12-8780 TaxID=2202200 RepID=UPI0021AE4C3C|nr:motility associated factor glycosyltransferase family protein [Campylobacter sp. MIT 12-8780]